MLPDRLSFKQLSAVHWPAIGLGGVLGIILSTSVLSGDQQGRVNLLYLLLVYFLLPVASLLLSLIAIFSHRSIDSMALFFRFFVVQGKQFELFRKLSQMKLDKDWTFMQSQLAALSYSFFSLLIFFVMLLVTDVNFVWRSTLLDANDMASLLEMVAWPWQFWEQAQPNLTLLVQTQDSRIDNINHLAMAYGHWWRFILMLQIVYCVLPRTLGYWYAKLRVNKRFHLDVETQLILRKDSTNCSEISPPVLAEITDRIAPNITVTNWAGVEQAMVLKAANLPARTEQWMNAGPLASVSEQMLAERWRGQQLILVKAWEPPLAELKDYLSNSSGWIWPLDWQVDEQSPQLILPRLQHIEEWRRFAGATAGWKIFLPVQLNPYQQPGLSVDNSSNRA